MTNYYNKANPENRRTTICIRLPEWIFKWLHKRKQEENEGIGKTIERALQHTYQINKKSKLPLGRQ